MQIIALLYKPEASEVRVGEDVKSVVAPLPVLSVENSENEAALGRENSEQFAILRLLKAEGC